MKSDKVLAGTVGCFLFALLFLAVYAISIFFGGWIFFLLYNALAEVFAWPVLTYWQSVIAVALISFVGGFFHRTVSSS